MTEPRNDDRSQARSEAAALLGVDIDHLSPACQQFAAGDRPRASQRSFR